MIGYFFHERAIGGTSNDAKQGKKCEKWKVLLSMCEKISIFTRL